jgi:hypothetical protein
MKKLYFLLSIFSIVLSCSSDETSTPPPPPPIVKYTITLSAGEGGTVSTTGGEYESGQTVSVTATPQREYLFKDWSDGNTDAARTITVSSNSTLTANFEKKKYPLTVNIVGEGEVIEEIVNAGRTNDYNSGTTVKLTAVPSEGWEFTGWEGAINGTSNPQQLLISEPKTVSATFNFPEIESNLFKESYSYYSENYSVGDIIKIAGVYFKIKSFSKFDNEGWINFMSSQYGISVALNHIKLSPMDCYNSDLIGELFFNSENGDFLMVRFGNLNFDGDVFHFLKKRFYRDDFNPPFNDNSQAKHYDNTDFLLFNVGKYIENLKDEALTSYPITLKVSEGGRIGIKNIETSIFEYINENTQITVFECDSYQIIAIPDEGYYHSGWSNDSFEDIFKIINGSQEVGAVFKKQVPMNGWYSIVGENTDLSNYPKANLEMDNFLFYFDENDLKSVASIKNVNEYWNIDTSERAIIFEGNGPMGKLGSDFFGYDKEYGNIRGEERDVIDSIIQLKDNIFTFSVLSKNELKSKWKAISFDFENSNKMTDYYSEIGFYSDSIYKEINPSDIRSYISAFFKDIKRYGGVTKFKEEDVKVEFNNYGGFGAFGTVCSSNPTIFFDKYWWDSSITKFYDKQNDGMAVIYHELGHAIFDLDHLCESGHIMTGWHGGQGGLECRGEKNTDSPFGIYDLFLPQNEEVYNFNRAVKDLVTLEKQFSHNCGSGKGGVIVQ